MWDSPGAKTADHGELKLALLRKLQEPERDPRHRCLGLYTDRSLRISLGWMPAMSTSQRAPRKSSPDLPSLPPPQVPKPSSPKPNLKPLRRPPSKYPKYHGIETIRPLTEIHRRVLVRKTLETSISHQILPQRAPGPLLELLGWRLSGGAKGASKGVGGTLSRI